MWNIYQDCAIRQPRQDGETRHCELKRAHKILLVEHLREVAGASLHEYVSIVVKNAH